MAVQVSYPGVYVEEFAPGAPIEGVGTSTAALIGPATSGDLNTPTKVTSWDQFRAIFGEQPLPGFFLWYAARGFFENGGQVCYVVRASNGGYASRTLADRITPTASAHQIIQVRARQPGIPAPGIRVRVTEAHQLPSAPSATPLFQPTAPYSAIAGREITVSSAAVAAQFRPGDWVTLNASGVRVQLQSVSGNTLRLSDDLIPAPPAPGTVRLADAPAGTRTIRIAPAAALPSGALVVGTLLTVIQAPLRDSQFVESVQSEPISPTVITYRVTFRQGLAVPLSLNPATPATVQSEEFNLEISQGASGLTPPASTTMYSNLSIDSAHPRYFATVVNNADGLVRVEPIEPPPPVRPPMSLPAQMSAALLLAPPLRNEELSGLTADDYVRALDTLRQIDDVNLIAIPDCTTLSGADPVAVQQAVLAQCELLGDRFAVLDAQPNLAPFGATSIETQRVGLDSSRGYAALYYPWLRVRPAGQGAPVLVPPSGHVCGVIARSDGTRGVHKAPANEYVIGALGVERTMSDVDLGELNLRGINVIRAFPSGGRPQVWGARTTATDRNWQYVNVRRLFVFLEESIEEGIRWAVFEPNNLALWQKLKRTITEFLTRVWRDGALFGETADKAFYVRIDETLNPFATQALGRLYIEVGVRPVYPAEFIILRIGIWQGGSEVSEG